MDKMKLLAVIAFATVLGRIAFHVAAVSYGDPSLPKPIRSGVPVDIQFEPTDEPHDALDDPATDAPGDPATDALDDPATDALDDPATDVFTVQDIMNIESRTEHTIRKRRGLLRKLLGGCFYVVRPN